MSQVAQAPVTDPATTDEALGWRIRPDLARMQSNANVFLAQVYDDVRDVWYTLESDVVGGVVCSCPERGVRFEHLQSLSSGRFFAKACTHVVMLHAEGLDVRDVSPSARRPLSGEIELIIPSFGWMLSVRVEAPNPVTLLSRAWVPEHPERVFTYAQEHELFTICHLNARQGRGDLVRKLKQYLARRNDLACGASWYCKDKPEWSGADALSIMRDGRCSACARESAGLIPQL